MRTSALRMFLVCAMASLPLACDDDDTAPPLDGRTFLDGPQDGGTVYDGPTITPDRGPPEAGWILTEQGPVQIDDGGVLVVEDGGETYICRPTTCDGKLLECGDCTDNDGDGLIDFRDPECLGPCDNTEGPGLESGVGGSLADSCGVDCYFDYGNGPGNDKCSWDHRCDTLSPEVGCEYDADFAADDKNCPTEQDPLCAEVCMPFTPNGCDCFGCCTFPDLTGKGEGGADVYVWIGNVDASNNSTCTLADLNDPAKCPPCTPVGNCLNECGRCEVCVGKPTVPEDCFAPPVPDGGVPDISIPEAGLPDGYVAPDAGPPVNPDQCDPGVQPCGLAGQLPCPELHYCISGCCKKTIL